MIKQPPRDLDLRNLPPCPKHEAAMDIGNGTTCRIPRIDNALFHAHSCDECLRIVTDAAQGKPPLVSADKIVSTVCSCCKR